MILARLASRTLTPRLATPKVAGTGLAERSHVLDDKTVARGRSQTWGPP